MRGSRQVEWINGYTDLVDWLEAAEAIPQAQAARLRRSGAMAPSTATAAWKNAIIIREALFRIFAAAAGQTEAARADLELVETAIASCATSSRLDWLDKHYVWNLRQDANSPRVAVHPILRSAADLLTSEALSRVRECGGETCSWLFLDETKNHSRRWCEMASCGNLAKVRRHRERSGQSRSTGTP